MTDADVNIWIKAVRGHTFKNFRWTLTGDYTRIAIYTTLPNIGTIEGRIVNDFGWALAVRTVRRSRTIVPKSTRSFNTSVYFTVIGLEEATEKRKYIENLVGYAPSYSRFPAVRTAKDLIKVIENLDRQYTEIFKKKNIETTPVHRQLDIDSTWRTVEGEWVC